MKLEKWKSDILYGHILQYMEHMEQEKITDMIVGYEEDDICGNDVDVDGVEKEQADPFEQVLSQNEVSNAPDIIN